MGWLPLNTNSPLSTDDSAAAIANGMIELGKKIALTNWSVSRRI
jgi:hypothetical protein